MKALQNVYFRNSKTSIHTRSLILHYKTSSDHLETALQQVEAKTKRILSFRRILYEYKMAAIHRLSTFYFVVLS